MEWSRPFRRLVRHLGARVRAAGEGRSQESPGIVRIEHSLTSIQHPAVVSDRERGRNDADSQRGQESGRVQRPECGHPRELPRGPGGCIRVGFDSSDKMIAALRTGELSGFVVQNPMQIGYLGVKTIVNHTRGEQAPRRIDTGSTLVTIENIEQPEIRELLNPDLSKY